MRLLSVQLKKPAFLRTFLYRQIQLIIMKISRAKSMLLDQDLKVYEVADRLGFESAFYFSKVFKKVAGVSPREFVQQKAEES